MKKEKKECYQLIDLGSGEGKFADWAKGVFGFESILCIEKEGACRDAVLKRGFSFKQGDVLKPRTLAGLRSDFVTLSHFLEHLPEMKDTERVLRRVVKIARKGIVVSTPVWDCDSVLRLIGARFYWSEWADHTAKITAVELNEVAKKLGWNYKLFASGFLSKLTDREICRVDSPSGVGPGENVITMEYKFRPCLFSAATLLMWQGEIPKEFSNYLLSDSHHLIWEGGD